MRTKAYLAILIALVTAGGVIGLVETVGATPNDSQRLRGLAGRVFLVDVDVVVDGAVVDGFVNCYFFDPNGVWYETGGTPLGTWVQHSNGASTTYSVIADTGEVGRLLQDGQVSPARGKGVLQLEAVSTLPDLELPFDLKFISIGAEIDESEVYLCPIPAA
ncbi:MAG: hypothetical protein OEN51_03650 [Gammaproteobacteria bacterium]|nr:hypothetical protein [Gammaproteobacteria bacterium]